VNSYLDDHYVIGLLKMIACILKHEPALTQSLLSEGVVQFLLQECLFSFDVKPFEGDVNKSVNLAEFKKQFQSKCMQSSSREAAYRLLVTICEFDDKSLERILGEYWVQLVEKVGDPKETGVVKPPEHRSSYEKFIGMKNLGAICYMISMLQQFFHVKAFRYSLLAAKDAMPVDLQPFEGRQVDDNVLHQLKAMFAAMELSDRSFFNPKDFCFAFKDFSGQPINVRIQ
jgi:ubiquitin carboxyl-terminal hydrolase 34